MSNSGAKRLTFLVVNERYGGSVRRVMTRRTSKRDGKGNTGKKRIKERKNGARDEVNKKQIILPEKRASHRM
jgi:hypothetical protein